MHHQTLSSPLLLTVSVPALLPENTQMCNLQAVRMSLQIRQNHASDKQIILLSEQNSVTTLRYALEDHS